MPEKRYQVFISSTFADLQEERQEVMHALLELDCIPAGMELFPAANEEQWELIKRVINDCDYYVLIVGGRYGSIGPDGFSYTEMEYRYALEKGKPIIAFLHKTPGAIQADRTERDPALQKKLEEFRELAKRKLVKYWNSPQDLGSVVSRSLIQLIKNTPAVGWVRANELPDKDAMQELIKLRRQVEELDRALQNARISAPPGTEGLAQGNIKFTLHYSFEAIDKYYDRTQFSLIEKVSWNELLSALGPSLLNEATDLQLSNVLNEWLENRVKGIMIKTAKGFSDFDSFAISTDDFYTVKVQLRALGLITKSDKTRSVKDNHTYWCLTPYGDQTLTRLRAISA